VAGADWLWAKRQAVLMGALIISQAGQAQLDDETIAEVRNSYIGSELKPKEIGASYAALVSFAVNPEIATAKFHPDTPNSISETSLKASRLPFRFSLNSPDDGDPLYFMQGLLARETMDATIRVTPDEYMLSRWETFGLSVTGGAEFPLNEKLSLITAGTVGVAHLQNDTSYRGEQVESVIRPIFDNFLLNWNARSVLVGASLALDYQRTWDSHYLDIHTSLSHNQLDSFNESGELIKIQGGITTLDAEVQSIHPLQYQLADHPLSIVFIGGATAFLGPNRNALGFNSFAEAGVGLQVDVTEYHWGIKALRVGYKRIVGKKVDGWALIISPQF